MKQEDKELLLKYLCAALPYGVFVSCAEGTVMGVHWNKVNLDASLLFELQDNDALSNVKPYLRPISSMTEEERIYKENYFKYDYLSWDYVCWLLEHHFDFIWLIPRDLAIEVTESNNPYKE